MTDLLQELARIRSNVGNGASDNNYLADQVADLCDIIASLAAKVQELERRLDDRDDHDVYMNSQGD